jgi:phosphomannomutase
MTLIKSISGFRGTIGGKPNDGLTPIDIVKFAAAYGTWLKTNSSKKLTVVIGRDARISGEMVNSIVCGTLMGLGIDVIDLGLSTTPTVEMAVGFNNADGGIIITASHNPAHWNALKLLNGKGEFISANEGQHIIKLTENDAYSFAEVNDLGTITKDTVSLDKHIDAILALPYVDVEAIKNAELNIVIDAINSTGAITIPALLTRLGVTQFHTLNAEMSGQFAHNPEPLAENLGEISEYVSKNKADFGIVVDPDVDRLAFVCEDGSMFGEEYTLVACADHVLSINHGNTVSNLSSTRALRDVTETHGAIYTAAAVGEVNVVNAMKSSNAVIGGEGNGGVILPELHYGRDALVGIALFLTSYVKKELSASQLRDSFPKYIMAKDKIDLEPTLDVDALLILIEQKFKDNELDTQDGLKIYFEGAWVHLRKSNTEPIIRIYSEAQSAEKAIQITTEFKLLIEQLSVK